MYRIERYQPASRIIESGRGQGMLYITDFYHENSNCFVINLIE
jgi:hypothetical protein